MSPTKEPFHWFQGKSVEKLTAKLTETPNPRLEVYQKNGKMTFVVVNGDTGKAIDPINDSHACPPTCP